jgi:predicted transcriptional regulator
MKNKNTRETNFVMFFGKNTRMKVFDFLIENDRTSWNVTEIMYHANVGHTCLLVVLKDLMNLGVIKLENKKYIMDKDNKITKLIYSLYNEINIMRTKQILNSKEVKNGKDNRRKV